MAEVTIAGQIANARAHGYTDDQIAAHFTKHPEYGAGITEALNQGYKPVEVLTQLSHATMPDYSKDPALDPGFLGTLGHAAMNAPKNLMDFITGHPMQEMDKNFAQRTQESGDAFRRGEHSRAVGLGLSAFLPGPGDEAVASGEEYGAGHPGAGTAHAIMALAPFLLKGAGEVAPRLRSPVTVGSPALPSLKTVIKTHELEGMHPGAVIGGGYEAIRQASRLKPRSPLTPKPVARPTPSWQQLPAPPEPVAPEFSPIPGPESGEMPSGKVVGPAPRPTTPVWSSRGLPAWRTNEPPAPEPPPPVQTPSPGLPGAPNARSAAWRADPANAKRGIAKTGARPTVIPPPPAEIPAGITPPPEGGPGGFSPEQIEVLVEKAKADLKAKTDADKYRRTDLNRAAHAIGNELDLPESPAGTKLSMGKVAKDLHGSDWTSLTTDQMNSIVEFMLTHRRPPTQADLASGLYK